MDAYHRPDRALAAENNPSIANKKKAIEKRRRQVAELWKRHVDQVTIAKQLGVAQSTVSRDLKAITKRWVEEAVRDVGEIRARELAELSQIEGDASKRFAVEHDYKWLDIRLKCKQRRAAMLGLDRPTKVAQTDSVGNDLPPVTEVVVELPPEEEATEPKAAAPEPDAAAKGQPYEGEPDA